MKSYDDQLKDDLKQCNSMNEIFNVVNMYYNMDEKLGLATKQIVISGVFQIIKILNAAKRVKLITKKWN